MIIILKKNPDPRQLNHLRDWLRDMDLEIHYSQGSSTTLMGLIGDTSGVDLDMIKSLDVVEDAKRIQEPYKHVSRKFHPEDTVVDVNGIKIGGGNFQIIAGPCSVESYDQILDIAEEVKESGATILRGGAFKPRTSPYSFQGMREEGIKMLVNAKNESGLPIVSEITDISQLELFEDVDILQVGARSMQNFELLKGLGSVNKPVLLKRGLSSTLDELLMSAEYIVEHGNPNVILCERGIRTFETSTKNTLDLSAIAYLKKKSHLPVIVDPSHATGNASLVVPMAMAAVIAGADAIMVEVHNNPQFALCDGPQAITPEEFDDLVKRINNIKPFAYEYKY